MEGLICVTEITLGHLSEARAGRKEVLWGQENGRSLVLSKGWKDMWGSPRCLPALPLAELSFPDCYFSPGPLVLKAL